MTFEEFERSLASVTNTLAEVAKGQKAHERQMQELRDSQVVQGAMLAKASNLLLEVATRLDDVSVRVKEIADRQAVTQSGIESLVKFMDAFKKRFEGGDGHGTA